MSEENFEEEKNIAEPYPDGGSSQRLSEDGFPDGMDYQRSDTSSIRIFPGGVDYERRSINPQDDDN